MKHWVGVVLIGVVLARGPLAATSAGVVRIEPLPLVDPGTPIDPDRLDAAHWGRQAAALMARYAQLRETLRADYVDRRGVPPVDVDDPRPYRDELRRNWRLVAAGLSRRARPHSLFSDGERPERLYFQPDMPQGLALVNDLWCRGLCDAYGLAGELYRYDRALPGFWAPFLTDFVRTLTAGSPEQHLALAVLYHHAPDPEPYRPLLRQLALGEHDPLAAEAYLYGLVPGVPRFSPQPFAEVGADARQLAASPRYEVRAIAAGYLAETGQTAEAERVCVDLLAAGATRPAGAVDRLHGRRRALDVLFYLVQTDSAWCRVFETAMAALAQNLNTPYHEAELTRYALHLVGTLAPTVGTETGE